MTFYEQRIPLLPEIARIIAEFCSENGIGLNRQDELKWKLGIKEKTIGIFISTSNSLDLCFVFYGERDWQNDRPASLPRILWVDRNDDVGRKYILQTLRERLAQIKTKLASRR